MRWSLGMAFFWVACSGSDPGDGNTDTSRTDPTDGTETPRPTSADIDATPLIEGLQGVWRDELAQPLDLAQAGDWLFGRAEWTGNAGPRWVFGLTEGGAVVRNMSQVDGVTLDHQAVLVSSQEGTWRFCHAQDGCSELAVDVTLSGYELTLSTEAAGEPGSVWSALKLREVPSGSFDPVEVTDPDPTVPALTVDASIFQPPSNPTVAVLAIARQRCQPGCVPSRVLVHTVAAGAKSVEFVVPELHTGTWYVTVFLDENNNAGPATSYQPDAGDLFALPDRELVFTGAQTLSIDLSLQL